MIDELSLAKLSVNGTISQNFKKAYEKSFNLTSMATWLEYQGYSPYRLQVTGGFVGI